MHPGKVLPWGNLQRGERGKMQEAVGEASWKHCQVSSWRPHEAESATTGQPEATHSAAQELRRTFI